MFHELGSACLWQLHHTSPKPRPVDMTILAAHGLISRTRTCWLDPQTILSYRTMGPSVRFDMIIYALWASPQGTLQRLSKKLGVDLRVARFVRLQCGEGLDNQKADFAAEVAAMTS